MPIGLESGKYPEKIGEVEPEITIQEHMFGLKA